MAGILAGAMLGGAGGAGQGMAEGAQLTWKEQMETERAKREERNIQLRGTIEQNLETNVRQPFQSEQGRLAREQQSSEGALTRQSHEATGAMHAESAQEVARINHANELERIRLQQRLKERDAMKDLPATIKEYIGVQRERLKALDAAENNPMTDDATRKGIAAQKAELNDLVEQALTTKAIPVRRAPAAPTQPAGARPPLASFFGSRQAAPAGPAGGPQVQIGPRQPSGQQIYGPLTPESIIENDAALGIPAAVAYKQKREQNRLERAARAGGPTGELMAP